MQKAKYQEPEICIYANNLDVLFVSGGAYVDDIYNDGWGEVL